MACLLLFSIPSRDGRPLSRELVGVAEPEDCQETEDRFAG
jgi:hypothetical protein